MFDKLNAVESRYGELVTLLADPAVQNDTTKYREHAKALSEIQPLVDTYNEYKRVDRQATDAQELVRGGDAEMASLAREELKELEPKREELLGQLKVLLLPKDPNDEKNVLLEIRAGTGGDEAALFAGELYRMYTRYAERQGWKLEVLSLSETGIGGIKEAIVSIEGQRVYSQLKYESGVHRVQRVPATEAQGRIHTSTCTVAVLPEAEEVDIEIRPDELDISVCRASGPGGQGVNTTDSAVQIIHKPTGLIVRCADQRSQQKNKARALTVLRSRLLERRVAEENAKYAAQRKAQVGTGERNERIRTYNFPQNRVTDHRIELTLYNLPFVMEGDIDPIIDPLINHDQEEKLAGLSL